MAIQHNSLEYYRNRWLGLSNVQLRDQLLATAHEVEQQEQNLRAGCQIDFWMLRDIHIQLRALQLLWQERCV